MMEDSKLETERASKVPDSVVSTKRQDFARALGVETTALFGGARFDGDSLFAINGFRPVPFESVPLTTMNNDFEQLFAHLGLRPSGVVTVYVVEEDAFYECPNKQSGRGIGELWADSCSGILVMDSSLEWAAYVTHFGEISVASTLPSQLKGANMPSRDDSSSRENQS